MSIISIRVPAIENPIQLQETSENEWTGTGEYSIKIRKDENIQFELLDKDIRLQHIEDDYLINLFIDEYNNVRKRQLDETASGIENDNELSLITIENIERPNFDPEQIRVDPRVYSLPEVMRFIDRGRINLSPDFQRYFVWKEVKKQSRLIESLLLRIPLPVFYLSEDGDSSLQVVDGLQRLTTIHKFYKNELTLKGLEYLEDCEGKTFETLATKYQNRIEDAQLSFNVIAPTTPVSVKFEIFKRINEGGKPLNNQEIRNSMAKNPVRSMIQRMANSEHFKRATANSVKPIRMEDQELILRYIGFYLIKYGNSNRIYNGDMESFLDDTLDYINKNTSDHLLNRLEGDFYNAMQNAFHLLGKSAFRKVDLESLPYLRKPLINKSLFTVWSVVLSQFTVDYIQRSFTSGYLIYKIAEEISQDNNYFEALTTGTNQKSKLNYSFNVAERLIQDMINTTRENA
ncbi:MULTISPECIES: DUF262 domain-containing protein [unclassified Arcicella]|uniref:DUF262 domain-containing protein n=1 Tax=unclassified Arcicella TaxID=2644986 RepID=UPI0028567D53|nr:MULTISPECIES: DUF262 domain-containing protein [unclassified Arcicella]MDR6560794.1 hypothetical protein [Arcicella sp. BE51]MDR6810678.1 hypothetical protein [Arcicella sp. BE140]MDR6822028.1 hypothetical protein [Arcicella sp. BE139]